MHQEMSRRACVDVSLPAHACGRRARAHARMPATTATRWPTGVTIRELRVKLEPAHRHPNRLCALRLAASFDQRIRRVQVGLLPESFRVELVALEAARRGAARPIVLACKDASSEGVVGVKGDTEFTQARQ